MKRVVVVLSGLLVLAGCGTAVEQSSEQPAFYLSMAHGGAKV